MKCMMLSKREGVRENAKRKEEVLALHAGPSMDGVTMLDGLGRVFILSVFRFKIADGCYTSSSFKNAL